MQIRFLKFGRVKSKEVLSLCSDYQRRIRAFFPCDDLQLKDSRDIPQAKAGLHKSGFMKDLEDAFIVVLHDQGRQWTNEELAVHMNGWLEDRRNKRLVFAIGDAYGVPAELRDAAQATWSLSKLVFTNEHAFLLAHEQVYRSLMIINGRAYHHD